MGFNSSLKALSTPDVTEIFDIMHDIFSTAVRSIVPLPQPVLQTLRVQLNTSYKFVESSITIECRLSNTQGRFNWTFQGKRLPSNAIVVNERSRSLLQINNFNHRNNGMYTCFAATGSGATLAEGQKSVYLEERPVSCVFTQ